MFALLCHHAWSRRDALGLSPVEAFDARGEIGSQLVSAAVGAVSVAWTRLPAATHARVSIAGFIYPLMGPGHWAYGEWNRRRRRAFEMYLNAAPATGGPARAEHAQKR